MKIGAYDTDNHVLVIAEAGNNHEGDFARAQALIRQAARCGADAIKFQTYRTEYYVRPIDRERFALLKSFELPHDQLRYLARLARDEGLLFISTPLDLPSVEVLVDLVDAFKIASGDLTFYPLLDRIAALDKPILMSTGASDWSEIERATHRVKHGRAARPAHMALMHCVSCYPSPRDQLNLRAIPWLQARFDGPIGYSDHSLGIDACVAATALGARIVEKHFTLDKNLSDYRDHRLSADPLEFQQLVQTVRSVSLMRGLEGKAPAPCEGENRIAIRRSIALRQSRPTGYRITFDDLVWLRPGTGLPPGEESSVVGCRLKRDYSAGELLSLSDLE